MITYKKLTFAALLTLFTGQVCTMQLDSYFAQKLAQKVAAASTYIPEAVQQAAALAWQYKLTTAATLTLGGLAMAQAAGYNPLQSLRSASKPRYQNFNDWKKACDTTCTSLQGTPLTFDEFDHELKTFIDSTKLALQDESKWIEKITTDEPYHQHRRYRIEKLEVEPGAEVAFHGDVHGDIHSFNAFIADLAQKGYMDPANPFKIQKPNFKIIMLGDYTDRGNSGLEVLYTIMRLKRLNPDQFFMVRGNHEDVNLNQAYGFLTELNCKKFNNCYLRQDISELYYKLPVALYLVNRTPDKKDALLCCHGGLELGSADIKTLLEDKRSHCYLSLDYIARKCCADALPNEYQPCLRTVNKNAVYDSPLFSYEQLGYMWNDFNFKSSIDKGQPIEAINGRGWKLPEQLTKYLLEKDSTPTCRLRGVFRAHQHDHNTMPRILNQDGKSSAADAGVAKLWLPEETQQPASKLWDGIICTFCVSPGAYGDAFNFNFDTYGILKTAEQFDDWRLEVNRLVTKQ